MEEFHERVNFKMIIMPCCGHQLCWVNPRLPNYCPECSKEVLAILRVKREHIMLNDDNAMLMYHVET